jgi:hypothetical protein
VRVVDINGKNPHDGAVRVIDHVEEIFVISTTSLHGIDPDVLKNLIESRFKVESIERVSHTLFVR